MTKHATSYWKRNCARVAFGLALLVVGSASGYAQVDLDDDPAIVDDPCPIGNYTLNQRVGSALAVLRSGAAPSFDSFKAAFGACDAVDDTSNALETLQTTLAEIEDGKVLSHGEQKQLSKRIEEAKTFLALLKQLLGTSEASDAESPCDSLVEQIGEMLAFLGSVKFLRSALSPARSLGNGVAFRLGVLPSASIDELNGDDLPEMDQVDATAFEASALFAVTERIDLGITAGGVSYSRSDASDGSEADTLIGNVAIDARGQVLGKGRSLAVAVDARALYSGSLAGGNHWSGRVGASIDGVFSDFKNLTLVPFGSAWITLREGGQQGYGLLGAVEISGNRYGALVGAESLWDQVGNDNADDYLDLFVGGRARVLGGSRSSKEQRMDLQLLYRLPLGDEGALPSDGYFSLALQIVY